MTAAANHTAIDCHHVPWLDTRVMLVEDPVKRVDTMTMAWGPESKLASDGKGVLKPASRALPSQVIDRTKDYFPVPGIRHPRGRDALTNDAARASALCRSQMLDALLSERNRTRTTLGTNALWQSMAG